MSEAKRLLFYADAHKWGIGHVHALDGEQERMLCGRLRSKTPGRVVFDYPDEINCGQCLRSIATQAEREQRQREWEQQRAEREQARVRERAEWDRAYREYLRSEIWLKKRRLVMRRAGGMCEGCGERRATEVHHMTYPPYWPGSAEWIRNEKLFDLKAVCRQCHEDKHLEKYGTVGVAGDETDF